MQRNRWNFSLQVMGPPSQVSRAPSVCGSGSSDWGREYEDEDTWYEFSSAYQTGPDAHLLPKRDTGLSLRMAQYRRSSSIQPPSSPRSVMSPPPPTPSFHSTMKERRDLRDLERELEDEVMPMETLPKRKGVWKLRELADSKDSSEGILMHADPNPLHEACPMRDLDLNAAQDRTAVDVSPLMTVSMHFTVDNTIRGLCSPPPSEDTDSNANIPEKPPDDKSCQNGPKPVSTPKLLSIADALMKKNKSRLKTRRRSSDIVSPKLKDLAAQEKGLSVLQPQVSAGTASHTRQRRFSLGSTPTIPEDRALPDDPLEFLLDLPRPAQLMAGLKPRKYSRAVYTFCFFVGFSLSALFLLAVKCITVLLGVLLR